MVQEGKWSVLVTRFDALQDALAKLLDSAGNHWGVSWLVVATLTGPFTHISDGGHSALGEYLLRGVDHGVEQASDLALWLEDREPDMGAIGLVVARCQPCATKRNLLLALWNVNG
jgi:hypothetical protein